MRRLEEFETSLIKFISFCLEPTSIDLQFYLFDVHEVYDSLRDLN